MCILLNWQIVHCILHVFSFSFVHAPVCANCKNDSCYIIQKKKKKKEKKNDPYFGMGKNTKVMPQKPHYLSFLLGKGGNPYVSKLYIKNSVKCTFCPAPSMQIILIQTLCGRRTPKLTKFNSLCCNFRTFPVTEGYAICNSISSSQPQQESSPTEPIQKGTNFRDTMFLRYLDPEKCQKSYPETARISATP